MRREQAIALAEEVLAGKPRSYVSAAQCLAAYVIHLESEFVPRIKSLSDELGEVVRDHDSGYGGTYNPVYAREREDEAWRILRVLAREAEGIAAWVDGREESEAGA